MRRDSWIMVVANLVGCIGVPFGLYWLARAYLAGARRLVAFCELDRANLAARGGRLQAAEMGYLAILKRVPAAAGVRANRAQARLWAGDKSGALDEARAALRDCANYARAAEIADAASRALGSE